MKLCITASGPEANDKIDPRFGRCLYFLFYDSQTDSYKAVKNKAAAASHGAGIEASRLVTEESPEAVITGNIGPNAANVLKASSLDIYSVREGTVAEVVGKYKAGKLKKIDSATVPGHFGLKRNVQKPGSKKEQ